jgi:hypothetical protein
MKGRKRTNTEQNWMKGENPGISKKKNPAGGIVFVLCLLYKDSSMERKVT